MKVNRLPTDDGLGIDSVAAKQEPQTKPAPQTYDSGQPNARRTISRRRLLQLGAGAGLAAMLGGSARKAAASSETSSYAAPALTRQSSAVLKAPNIIVLMTDQERHHMHWPQGWAEKNLPGMQRLKRHGLYFNRAYTAVTQCSPSRAVMMTGRFAPVNRVTRTFLWPGLVEKDRQANIASLLKEKAGYETVWKGKWHLSYAANAAPGNSGEDWTSDDIAAMEKKYGWSQWNPPDGGNAIERWQPTQFGRFDGLSTLGGATADNDSRYINGPYASRSGQTPGFGESAVEFLKNRAPKLGKPFCLFISLINPHDVYVYPSTWKEAGYELEAFAGLGVELPPNYADDLSTKPRIQKATREAYDKFAPLRTPQERREYVNFYAYLNKLVDKHVMTVLNTLEETGLMDKTIIIRMADHGEGGMSHGLREKAYTVYEEMIHIPLIIHNPKLYPEPVQTEAFYDHLDLLPTVLDLAGVANPNSYALGSSIVPVIKDASRTVRDHTLFSFDDLFFIPPHFPNVHIRAIRSGDWTYAVYFDAAGGGIEYELYNIKSDPLQLKNLAYGTPKADVRKEWSRQHRILTRSLIEASNLPDSFAWPLDPESA
jgi:arylsulfatase A-like enzyme